MKHFLFYVLFIVLSSAFLFCGNLPSTVTSSTNGNLEIRVWINKNNSATRNTRSLEITWDRLVVQIYAHDLDTILDTFDITMENPFFSIVVEDIPAGTDRFVNTWTIDDEGDIIHTTTEMTVTINPAQTAQIAFILNPIVGSIYVQLTDIPTNVDSVAFCFSTNEHVWEDKDSRTAKLNLCVDKIPFGTTGTLSIVGISATGDTITSWTQSEYTFNNTNITLNVSFITVGQIEIQVTIYYPGITVILGIMDTTDSIGDENGGLLISEIMYSANDSEYVEIYNPTNTAFNDTIILQRDNGTYRFYYVTIPPFEFYVIGRDTLPWGDTYHSTQSALDLSGTTGNWITLRSARDSSILDIVAFQAGSNNQEWPNFSTSTRASIILDSLPNDPEYNNYGRNWYQATTHIDTSVTRQFGTPGIR